MKYIIVKNTILKVSIVSLIGLFSLAANAAEGAANSESWGSPVSTYSNVNLGSGTEGIDISAVQLGLSITQIEESLDVKDRSPMRITNFSSLLQAINPLGFLQLFSNGKTLATLVTVGALQCFCEGKCISDLNQTYMMQQLKLPADRRALYVTGFGIAMTLSGYFGKETIKNMVQEINEERKKYYG